MKIKSVNLFLLKMHKENYSFENCVPFFSILIGLAFLNNLIS